MVILPPKARDIRDSDRQGFGRLRRDRNRRFEYDAKVIRTRDSDALQLDK